MPSNLKQELQLSVLDFEVCGIEPAIAQAIVKKHHYLKRAASCMFAFGLFNGMELLGVLIYGKPANQNLCRGVCGPEESDRVLELTRLWVQDGTLKNTESFFIGQTLKMLPAEYDIIVSYAEISAGHRGVIYQATNWIYTGLSDAHLIWEIEGQETKHSRHLLDSLGGTNKAKEFYGNQMKAIQRGRKHRYVMLRGSRSRKKQLLAKLRYKMQSYPKGATWNTQT